MGIINVMAVFAVIYLLLRCFVPLKVEYAFSMNIASSVGDFWHWAHSSDDLNRRAKLPKLENMVDEQGKHHAWFTKFWFMKIHWIEHDFQTIWAQFYELSRTFLEGPFRFMKVRLEVQPKDGGGCRLTYTILVETLGLFELLISFIEVRLKFMSAARQIFADYDAWAQKGRKEYTKINWVGFQEQVQPLSPLAEQRIEQITGRLLNMGADPQLLELLLRLIRQGDDITVSSMQPYVIADGLGVDRKKFLELCFMATRLGLLQMQCEVRCIRCRGIKVRTHDIADVAPKAHCDACKLDFSVDLTNLVEITFTPDPTIRPLGELLPFCMGSPPEYVLFQVALEPRTAWQLQFNEPPASGSYIITIIRGTMRRSKMMEVTEYAALREVGLLTDFNLFDCLEDSLHPRAFIDMQNLSEDTVVARMERAAWAEDRVTVGRALAMEIFLRHFPRQQLNSPTTSVQSANKAIVFTDWGGSTRFTRSVGDGRYYDVLVDHYQEARKLILDEGGYLIKTVGDALMVIFEDPCVALLTMLWIQQEFNKKCAAQGIEIVLRMGIHYGPCLVGSPIGVLDVFGDNVNFAARLEGVLKKVTGITTQQIQRGGAVISKAMYKDPAVHKMLDAGWHVIAFQEELAGFDEPQQLYFVCPPDALHRSE